MRAIFRTMACAFLFACAGACSGSGGTLSADQACADYVDTVCDLEQKCDAPLINDLWGNVALCKERRRLSCPSRFRYNGANDTPDRLAACTHQLSGLSCDQFWGPW